MIQDEISYDTAKIWKECEDIKSTLFSHSKELGKRAHIAGLVRAPSASKEMMAYVFEEMNVVSPHDRNEMYKAFLEGWDEENTKEE